MQAAQTITKATVSPAGFGVFRSINAVQRDLFEGGGIGKNQRNTQQKYAFRGIDDVLNALSPALVKNGLVIMPEVMERVVTEKPSRNGGILFYVTVKVRYTFISAEDGSSYSVIVYGEAMDSGDKATNKAMSAAYKYMAIQSFAIATEGDNDADYTTHNPQYNQQPPARQQQQPQPVRQLQQQQPQQRPQPTQNNNPRQSMENGPDNDDAWAAAREDEARQASPVINPQQYKNVMQLLHKHDIPEQKFCMGMYIQGVGLLKQFDYEKALRRIDEHAKIIELRKARQ